MRPDVRYRLAGLAILIVAAVLLAVFVDVPNVADLPREYAGTGLFGGLGFALVYAVLSLLPLPATVFTLAAGAVFGLARGLPIVVLGATLGAIAAFYLGRVLGRDVVKHFTGARLQTLQPVRWDQQPVDDRDDRARIAFSIRVTAATAGRFSSCWTSAIAAFQTPSLSVG